MACYLAGFLIHCHAWDPQKTGQRAGLLLPLWNPVLGIVILASNRQVLWVYWYLDRDMHIEITCKHLCPGRIYWVVRAFLYFCSSSGQLPLNVTFSKSYIHLLESHQTHRVMSNWLPDPPQTNFKLLFKFYCPLLHCTSPAFQQNRPLGSYMRRISQDCQFRSLQNTLAMMKHFLIPQTWEEPFNTPKSVFCQQQLLHRFLTFLNLLICFSVD